MRGLPAFLSLLVALVLGACTTSFWDPTMKVGDPQGHMTDKDRPRRGAVETMPLMREESIALRGDGAAAPKTSIKAGTGTFVRKITPPKVDTTPGDVTLNFDGTDIREVVKVVLGDLLQVNYVIDPQVTGAASLQTERPLRREHLIPTLETLLRMNNAALIESGGSYQVKPISSAVQGLVVPQLGSNDRALPAGYGVQVIPLQYIGAEEMGKILEPLVPQGSVVRSDTLRNLLVVAGSGPELGNIIDTVRTFDVDWMSGLSVGFFTLEYAKANDVATQLEKLLSDEGSSSFKGIFRFVPVESANSLLVVSPQERYLQQVRGWIERLDSAEAAGEASERLYVYRVRHGDAEKLAEVLSQLFGDTQTQRRSKLGGVAPGLTPASIKSQEAGADADRAPASKQRTGATAVDLGTGVSVVADVANNSLLIKAPPKDYKRILDALKQLDITPLQVLVEATIVEITLSGQLKYGVQWQFFGGKAAARSSYSLTNAAGSAGTETGQANLGLTYPGFNYALVLDPGNVRATLSALASDGLVNVLSSPSVMVMDNQTAKMQVGQQVPILTQQQQSTSTTSNLVNSVEYKDTGVILTVKPRVTPGGMVQMEIEQEITTPGAESSLGTAFLTRKITSSVAVRSNQAVVLGGLIQDQRSNSEDGVPGLYSLPIIGALFGETTRKADRTELVVVITPRVIASDSDALGALQDFRKKVKGLEFKF